MNCACKSDLVSFCSKRLPACGRALATFAGEALTFHRRGNLDADLSEARQRWRTRERLDACRTTNGSPTAARVARGDRRAIDGHVASALTFEVRGGRNAAKLHCGRPLD